MSECTIIVRDASRAIHRQIHASYVDWFVAALADDPETIEELDFALRRFLPEHGHDSFFRRWRRGADAEPWDAGFCAIDLPGRLIAWESTYDYVARSGGVAAKNRDGKPDVVPFHLAEDWHISSQIDHWEANANDRRAKRIPRFDIRPVLYDGVCEFIARATAATSNRPPAADKESYPLIAAIHERWLMEPRDDLHGRPPRDVMLADREHLSWQNQDRCEWWSTMGKSPPALPRNSVAYRLGGFGTDEVVLYYNLVRFLATDSWDQVVPMGADSEEAIAAETHRLMQLRDEWLATVDYNYGTRPPAALIELERRRVPVAMTREESIIDHDCPLCQMAADSFSPMFSHLDGCNFDQGFAFSMFRTREEWEEQEREYAEMSRRMDERRTNGNTVADSIWKSSFGADNLADTPPTLAVFGLAAHLSELTTDLKESDADQALIDDLNRYFGNLREVIVSPGSELVEPAIDRFCHCLHAISEARPMLFAKKCDLEYKVRAWVDRLTGKSFDEGVPF